MKTSLVIMAAGIGSRFGEGIKQLSPVGPNGEIIMDYSIHDAIAAGFNKIIFIIRKDIEKDFREIIGDRIEKVCKDANVEVEYAFQSLDDLPDGYEVPEGRTKPWGTGQAILACRGMIHEPFCVLNADDYYGKKAFKVIHDWLVENYDSSRPADFCMAGFFLKNTLSENGGVTRGVCNMENGYLTDVQETSNIIKTAEGAEADGKKIDVESLVSMNFWGFTPDFIGVMEEGFKKFFKDVVPTNPEKCEFLIPTFVGELLEQGKVKVKVLKSNDTWYGMTYKEDVPVVKESFKEMIESGKYKADLYEDLH